MSKPWRKLIRGGRSGNDKRFVRDIILVNINMVKINYLISKRLFSNGYFLCHPYLDSPKIDVS